MKPSLERAIELTQKCVYERTKSTLTEKELAILRGAWEGLTYKQIGQNINANETLLRVQTGNELWTKLAHTFGLTNFYKRNYKAFMIERLLAQDVNNSEHVLIKGGQLPSTINFCGRNPEIAMLRTALSEAKCVCLSGPTGIGKTALAATVVRSISGFSQCIWRNLDHEPTEEELLEDLLYHLKDEDINAGGSPFNQLIKYLSEKKYLIVLDAIKPGSQNRYDQLLSRVIQEAHKSCILLTTKVPIRSLKILEKRAYPVYNYKIKGLGKDAHTLLKNLGLSQDECWDKLISVYTGNPMILSTVASWIKDYYNGDVHTFVDQGTTLSIDVFDSDFTDILEGLSNVDRSVIAYVSKEICSTDSIIKSVDASTGDILQALTMLLDLSLIEIEEESGLYRVPPVMKKSFSEFISLS